MPLERFPIFSVGVSGSSTKLIVVAQDVKQATERANSLLRRNGYKHRKVCSVEYGGTLDYIPKVPKRFMEKALAL